MTTIKTQDPIYNTIGTTYDTTRKADPGITQKIIHHLNVHKNKRYLDIACGSGNYTGALNKQNVAIDGVDISSEMLKKAQGKYPDIKWHQGDARQLPFEANTYDGAICTFATHHIKDITTAFKEAFRVISKGRFVIFTATPEQCHHYWLREYFPIMIENSSNALSSFEQLRDALSHAGFSKITSEPFFATAELEDLFLQSGKYRPEIYLDPAVRAGISSFHLWDDKNETATGLVKLKQDIDSGKIKEVIQKYENSLGDYLFVIAEK